MNCSHCQRQLLEEQVGPEVEAHLAECLACRQWHKMLLQMESHVPLLPVPQSPRRLELQQELIDRPAPAPETIPFPTATVPLSTENLPSMPAKQVRWHRLGVGAAGVAAAAVLVACGIFLGNMLSPPAQKKNNQQVLKKGEPEKTLAGKLVDLDMKLAQADSPRERLQTLAKLAHNLEGESRSLAQVAGPKELHTLAKLYARVVEEGLVQRAKRLPPRERRQVLDPILGQLMVAKKEAEELAQKAPAESAVSFQVIAAAARSGDLQLRKLMEETP